MAQVYVSSVLPASAGAVWEIVRDFGALARWHPGVRDSRIEDALPPDQVGCVRRFSMADGGTIRERLLALSDYELSCTYSILESPMPLVDYVATLRLIPVTDGDRCFAEWSAEFVCDQAQEKKLVDDIARDVFQAGFRALSGHFGG